MTPVRERRPDLLKGYVLGNLIAAPAGAVALVIVGAWWAVPIMLTIAALAALLWWHG